MTLGGVVTAAACGLGLGLGAYYLTAPLKQPPPPWQVVVGPKDCRTMYEEDGPRHTITYDGTLSSLRHKFKSYAPGAKTDQQRLLAAKDYFCSEEGFAALRLDKRCETSIVHNRTNDLMLINKRCYAGPKSNVLVTDKI